MHSRGPLKTLGALGVCILLYILIFTVLTPFADADDVIMSSSMGGEESDRFYAPGPRRKKPFCNAFTGCGKKRSMLKRADDESMMATLVDLNSEPAVDDLTRQIMSEAKILDAIQEARNEIFRQHDKVLQAGQSPRPRPLLLRPYRKRRSVDPSDFDRRFAADTAGRLRFF